MLKRFIELITILTVVSAVLMLLPVDAAPPFYLALGVIPYLCIFGVSWLLLKKNRLTLAA